MRLFGLLQSYIEWIQVGRPRPVTEQTLTTYRKNAFLLIKEMGNIEIGELDLDRIESLKQSLYDRKCSVAYVERQLIFIRCFIKFLEKKHKIKTIEPESIELPRRDKKNIKYLHEDEVKIFIKSIYREPIASFRFFVLVLVLLDTGIRVSEALALKRTDINWKKKSCVVLRKGQKEGVTFFHEWSLKEVKRYLAMRGDDNPYIFVSHYKRSEPQKWTYGCAQRYFGIFSRLSGIKATAHIIRKTAANIMARNGANIRDIQLWLGHSKVTTTETFYIAADYERVQRIHSRTLRFSLDKRGKR